MNTIELSAGFMSGLPQRVIQYGQESLANGISSFGMIGEFYDGNYWGTSVVRLYKGIVPTTSWGSPFNSRDADLLVEWPSSALTKGTYTTNPVLLSSNPIAATASGTATFFTIITRILGYRPSTSDTTMVHQTIGTVGLVGSSSELELTSTEIVAGQLYDIANFRMLFPSSWTY